MPNVSSMPHHYELPIVSFLAVILVLLPLPWHWKARNVATLSLIAWLVVINFMRGVNSIVWMDNVRIHYRWWCDITTKVFMGVGVALPACSFCITRNLEHIASTRVAMSTAADKKRRRIIDFCITIGFPVLIMALHYIVQGHRFDILEDIGCNPSVYMSIPALFILTIPPLALSVGSLIYATLALRHFVIRRAEFERHLRDSQSALTTSRYMRLMSLAITEMVWGTTLGSYIAFANIKQNGLRPWVSWDDVHYNFSRVALFPAFLLTRWQLIHLYLSWWIAPATAFLFFMFFGFSEEAVEGYANSLRWVRRTIFRQDLPPAYGGSYGKNQSLPQFVKHRRPDLSSRSGGVELDLPDLKPDFGHESTSPFDAAFFAKVDIETGTASSIPYCGPDDDLSVTAQTPISEQGPSTPVSNTLIPPSRSHAIDRDFSPARSPTWRQTL